MGIKEALEIAPEDIKAEKEIVWLWSETSGEMFLTNRVCIDVLKDFPTGILLSRLLNV